MTIYDAQLVVLPDGSVWVRREDVMVRWPGDPEALVPQGEFVAVAIEEAALPAPKARRRKGTRGATPKARKAATAAVESAQGSGYDWLEAERLYREGEKLKVVAEKLAIPLSTLYARAKREAWAA